MRDIKFDFIEDFGTPHAKRYPFTIDGISDCMSKNGDDNVFPQLQYYDYILNGKFPNVKLIQFTGRIDKTGREIYDGDGLTFPDSIDKSNENGFDWEEVLSTGYIFWNDEIAGWDITGRIMIELSDFLECDSEEIEIIGNIYENPELIEKK